MRRALAFFGAAALTGCSLVFGIYDNHDPGDAAPDVIDAALDTSLDAPVDAAPDVAEASNGCPEDAGQHTFCELFDESPPWPAGASMAKMGNATLVDAGCYLGSPFCITAKDSDGLAQRTYTAPASGVREVVVDLGIRSDANIMTNNPPRAVWVDINGTTITFGITFSISASVNDAFLFGVGASVTSFKLSTAPSKQWLHAVLDINFETAAANATIIGNAPQNIPFSDIGSTLAPSAVKSLAIHAGQGTSATGMAGAVDTILVDITPN